MSYASTAKWLLISAIVYTIAIYAFADPIAAYSQTADPLIGLLLYFATQSSIILMIAVAVLYTQSVHKSTWRGLVGGLLIGIWSDSISLPHCVPATGFPTEAVNYACSDTLIIKMLTSVGLPFGVSYTFYYLFFALLLLFGGFLILGKVGFTEFFGGAKRRG